MYSNKIIGAFLVVAVVALAAVPGLLYFDQ